MWTEQLYKWKTLCISLFIYKSKMFGEGQRMHIFENGLKVNVLENDITDTAQISFQCEL